MIKGRCHFNLISLNNFAELILVLSIKMKEKIYYTFNEHKVAYLIGLCYSHLIY